MTSIDANLTDADLTGANLSQADLTGAYMTGVKHDAETATSRATFERGPGFATTTVSESPID